MKSATTFQQRLRWLNEKQREYESPAFIAGDPISVPHQYSKKQDIEIAGFFAATLAWGAAHHHHSKYASYFAGHGQCPARFFTASCRNRFEAFFVA